MTSPNLRPASQLAAHVPLDRLLAMVSVTDLPRHAEGSVLFADLSGFTPLTELLMRTFGARRGAEELTQLLDQVYEQIIASAHRFGGSVIGFSGDAITCWFPSPDGLAAIACGLAMQQDMAPFAAYPLAPDQPIALKLKVAIAGGAVQRFLVGDPAIQLIDILVGAPLGRLSALEKQARSGEVIVDRRLAAQVGSRLAIAEWRAAGSETQGAIVIGLSPPPAPAPLAPPDGLPDGLERWVAPTVLARLQDQNQAFLTELRPTIALFLGFSGPDEYDSHAQADLDTYIRWVQHILLRYGATLIQLTLGEKGNYLYASFGAPLAHEDDAVRAVRAALELRGSPHAVQTRRIGIAQGIARTGVYGSSARRTYGVLGDAVNLAARLMQHAHPGQILANDQLIRSTDDRVEWQSLPPLTVKGKGQPLETAALLGLREQRGDGVAVGDLVGREAELAAMRSRLEAARQCAGQVLVITGEPGIGKSRLAREALRMLGAQDVVLSGATQSYAAASPYLCWIPIWQAIFGVAPAEPLATNLGRVTAALERLAPRLQPQLPLLASVLNLPIPENDLTRTLDAPGRKERLETLLTACLGAYARELAAAGRSLLLILEDLHWIDALSADLLRLIAPLLADLPAALVATSRPTVEAAPLLAGLGELPHASPIALAELSPEAVSALLGARLPAEEGVATSGRARLIEQVQSRANGNPFYVEELISYLVTSDAPIDERYGWQQLDLPIGLHRLVLSRIDRLDERQQRVLKTASVLGGSFPQRWLWESYPALGDAAQVRADLAELQRSDLLAAADDPEVCRFKHAITREVTYESLSRGTRAQLHEECAAYLERGPLAGEEPLDLLAYHYEQSRNDEKAVVYLARNAERAMHLFANHAAADQYRRAIGRAGKLAEPPLPQANLERGLGEVYAQMAEFDQALGSYDQALADMPEHAPLERAEIAILKADVLVRATRFDEAVALIDATEADLRGLAPEGRSLPPAARVLQARLAELRSIKSQRQADLQQALYWAEQGLHQIARLPAADEGATVTRMRLYQAAAAAAMNTANYPRARRMLRNAFRLIKRYPHPAMEAELRLRQALVLLRSERLGAAIRQFRVVLPHLEATGTRDRLAYALLPGGQALSFHGAYAEAEAWLMRGVRLGKEIGSAFLVCAGLSVLCWLNNRVGNWDAVLEYSTEGKLLAERHELRSWFTEFLTSEGEIRLYRGEFERSAMLFKEHRTYNDRYDLAQPNDSQRYLAYNAFLAGRLTESIEYMNNSPLDSVLVTTTRQALDMLGIAEWWVLLRAHGAELSHDEATLANGVANSIAILQKRGFRGQLPYALRVQAMLEWHADDMEKAYATLQQGLIIARRIGNVPDFARCLFWRAKIAVALNQPRRAMSDLHEAAHILQSLGAWPEHSKTQALLESPHDRSIVL